MDVGVELLFVRAHEADERLIADVFVARRPEDHFGKHGSEVNALRGKRIDALAPIGGIFPRREDAEVFETTETVGENVGGDFFVGLQKLVKAGVTAQHHVAQNEQRPAIAKHFDRGVQRAAGTPLRSGPLFRHFATVTYFYLQGASYLGGLSRGNESSRDPSGRMGIRRCNKRWEWLSIFRLPNDYKTEER